MSETTEEGRPGGRRSSSGSGHGRARGRGRRGISKQQRVPGGQLTTTSSLEKSLPEGTYRTQDQYQDSIDSDDRCEATASRGATLQDSPKPGTHQTQVQIEATITARDSMVYESILPSVTTQDGNQAVVLTKLEDKTPDKSNQMNRAIKVADLEESWNQNDDADHKSALLINVSSLPYQTSEEDITSYFERQGDKAEVCSVQIHGDGRATIKLIGLTEEEQTRLQTRMQHKINKQRVNVEIMTQIPHDLHQEDPDSTSSSQMSSTAMEYDTIEVTDLPNQADEECIELYFDSPRSGGCDDAVKSITMIQPGIAHVQFHDPKVAMSVVEKPGVQKLLGAELKIRALILSPASNEDLPEQYELNKIIIHCIPEDSVINDELLSLFVQNRLQLGDDECVISVVDNRALITLPSEYTLDELKDMITKLESKPLKQTSFRGELYEVCRSVRVREITKNYDESFLELYFESTKKSGGGEVEAVELLGDGEAVITFKDSKVVATVMEKEHYQLFGSDVKVERNDPLRFPDDYQKPSIAHEESSAHEEPVVATGLSTSLPLQSQSSCAKPSSAIKVKSKEQPSSSNTVEVPTKPLIVRYLSQYPEELKEEIKDLHVQLNFDKKQGKVICVGTRKTKSGWREIAGDIITKHIKNYASVTDHEVPKDAGPELMSFLCTMKVESPLEFEFSNGGTTFSAVGRDEVIIRLKTNMQSIFDRYTVVSINISYCEARAEYQFLSQVKLPQMKDQLPPTVMINEDHSIPALKVQGMKKYVEQFQHMLPEISHHCNMTVNLDPDVVHYFQSNDGQLQLQSFITKSNCSITTLFQVKKENVQLILLGSQNDRESMKTIAGKLAKNTGTANRTVPRSFLNIQSQLDDYIPLWHTLQEKYHVCIGQSANTVTVAGLKDTVSNAIDELFKFIMEKCTIVYEIEMERGELRLLQTHMRSKWSKITECSKASGILFQVPTLTSEDEDSTSTVVLKGEKDQVLQIFHQVSALKESISKRSITVERAGTNYFVTEHARLYLDGIEARTNVIIEVAEPIKIKDSSNPASLSGSASSKFSRRCTAKLQQSSCQVSIYIGDITDFEKAEVIVNAANCDLKHIGGVAAAILSRGGSVIQEASDRYTKRKGKLVTGDAWLSTDTGNLPCKALVHAVGPMWHNGINKEEKLLEKACMETLRLVSHGYQSIAFPAISSGIYGFPIDKCAKCMTKAIINYCESNTASSLKEICIIIHSSKVDDADHFISALKQRLPQGSVIVDQGHGDNRTYSVSSPIPQYSGTPSPSADGNPSRSSRRKKSGRRRTSGVTANVLDRIQLTRGSLLDVKADVLVNTTNRELKLSSGAVSLALLKVGGQQLQAECTKKAPINTGDVAVTGPGALPCRYVFHTVVPNYNEKGAEKILKSSVHKCLKECSSRGATSIAFPSIGTGNLHFPNDVVANSMVDEVINFLTSQKTSSIKTVHLVIFMPDTYQAFQQVLAGTGEASTMPTPLFTSPNYQHMSHSLPKGVKYRLIGSRSLTKPTTSETLESHSFNVGKLRVRIIKGDITEDDSDVIVNPTNAQMKLEGAGVAAALLRKGGMELQKLCITAIGNIKVLEGDNVAKTPSAGNLKCKELFHINFEGRDQKRFMKIISACLNEADQQHSSIALPAIGTGVHGYPPQEAAANMLQAFQNFAPKSRTVKQVHIVIFDPSVYQDFVTVFQNPEKAFQPGMFRRAAKYMGSFFTGDSTPNSEVLAIDEEISVCEELEIKLFGETEDAVKNAERKVEILIDETFSDKNIDDPLIETLPEEEVHKLRMKCREMHVEITVDRSILRRIRLKGNRTSVDEMYGIVNEVLREYEKNVSKMKQAKQIFQNVRWKRMDSDESDYSEMENFEIETAYQAKLSTCTFGTMDSPEHYTIDFRKELETDHNERTQYKVVRVDLIKQRQEGERPSTWDQMPVDSALYVVDLPSSSTEYTDTKQMFDQTMAGGYTSILKIQRIQNPALYFQYIVRKKEMDKHNTPGHQNERRLFHGTSVDTCPKVNQSGFNRSFAGKNATVYGNGVYFARDASYSARNTYSPPDVNGYRYIYLARVLSGEFTTGNNSMIVPPYKDQARHILYDSVVDNVPNPQIFVIFHDALVYPEYLIVFC